MSGNLKKLLDNSVPFVKRFKFCIKYLDGTKNDDETMKTFYEKHHPEIFRIFEETLRTLDSQVKAKKGNRTISQNDTYSLLRILNGFPLYNKAQLLEGWRRAAFDQLIEVFLDTKNTFQVRIRMFEFLVRTIDVLTAKTDDKLLDLLNSTLNYKVFPGGGKVMLPFYDVKRGQDIFRIPRTSTQEKAEEAIEYFRVMFNVIKETEHFEWWWNFLKDHFFAIVFPKDTLYIMKKEEQQNIGFLNSKCPIPIYLVCLEMIFHSFSSKARRDIFYKTHEDLQLVLMVLEKAFEVLSFENITEIELVMKAYEGWLIGTGESDFVWEGIFEKEREQYYTLLITSSCKLIENFVGNETVWERHIKMSYQLIDILKIFCSKGYLSHSFKSFFMKKVLNLYDVLMRKVRDSKYNKDYAAKVEKNLIKECFAYYISIHPDLYEYREEWTNFQNIVQKYFEQDSVFEFWNNTMINLEVSIIKNLFRTPAKYIKPYQVYDSAISTFVMIEQKKKKNTEMKEEKTKETWEVPRALFDEAEHGDSILQMYHIFLSFYGVENKKYSVGVHGKKVKTLSKLVNFFLEMFDNEVSLKTGHKIPHVPEANRLLELFIGPLLEACYRDDESFVYGRLDAFVSLCKIFCYTGKFYVIPIETENLARFFRAVYKGLNEKSDLIVNDIILYSWNLFSFNYPGCHLLLPKYMKACCDVILRSRNKETLNLSARKCLNSLIPILYFYEDTVIPSMDEKSKEKTVSFQTLREKLFKFYESQSKAKHEYPSIETHILWGLYFFVTYEIDRSTDVRHIIQLIINSLLSSSNEVWITSHDIITSIAQMRLVRRMDPETVMRLVQEICFKILHLRITGFQNPTAIVSLIYTLLEVIVEIPFHLFVSDKSFSTLIFKMIAFARESKNEEIRTAADVLLTYTLNFLNRFPLPVGSDVISSDISEFDYMKKEHGSFVPSKYVHHFVFNESRLFTIVDLPEEDQYCLLIIRDVTGRYIWKCKFLYEEKDTIYETKNPDVTRSMSVDEVPENPGMGKKGDGQGEGKKAPIVLEGPPEHDEKINTDKTDMLNLYQMYVTSEFPECDGFMLNVLIPVEDQDVINENLIEEIVGQSEKEDKFILEETLSKWQPVLKPTRERGDGFYPFGRMLVNHLGLLSPEFKGNFLRINSSHHFYRRLKHVDDKLRERETIKVGIIYVKNGQEHEGDVLLNSQGSKLFMEFLQNLSWEIDLGTHKGFMGGLQRNGSTGDTTHYFSNATTELIFHISTYMPTKEQDLVQVKKKRHIGNDWIHIVWSEHDRDYRRWTIQSQFNYAHIIIYPLCDPLFRVCVIKKEGVPIIGPLQEFMVIDKRHLSSLVRQTAINANKVVRYTQPGVKKCYLIRKDAISEITEQYAHEEDNFEGIYSYLLMDELPEEMKQVKKKKKKVKKDEAVNPLLALSQLSKANVQGGPTPGMGTQGGGTGGQATTAPVNTNPTSGSSMQGSGSSPGKQASVPAPSTGGDSGNGAQPSSPAVSDKKKGKKKFKFGFGKKKKKGKN